MSDRPEKVRFFARSRRLIQPAARSAKGQEFAPALFSFAPSTDIRMQIAEGPVS